MFSHISSSAPGLTHRYPDRCLFLITDQCSMYCRHCTRRRFAGQSDCNVPRKNIDLCLDYVRNHPEIRDVLLSGGDCLMVSDETLEYIISSLREIPHVEIVRLGSRTPVVMPQRITPELCNIFKKYHPVWLNTHFNTPNEITEEAAKACAMLGLITARPDEQLVGAKLALTAVSLAVTLLTAGGVCGLLMSGVVRHIFSLFSSVGSLI